MAIKPQDVEKFQKTHEAYKESYYRKMIAIICRYCFIEVREMSVEIPEYIFNIINGLIVEKYHNGYAIVYISDIKNRIYQHDNNYNIPWSNILKEYNNVGWIVNIDITYDMFIQFNWVLDPKAC